MKKLFFVLILLFLTAPAFAQVAANTAITDLDRLGSPATDDLMILSDTSDSVRTKGIRVDALLNTGGMLLTGLSDVGSSTQGAGRILISEGTDFDSIALSGDITLTAAGVTALASDSVSGDEIASSGVSAGTYLMPTIIVDADGRLSYAESGLLTGLSDVGSATQGAGRILISEGTDFDSIAISGDITLTAAGVTAISSGAVDYVHLADDAISGAAAVGTFASGDTFLCLEAGVGLRECDYDDLPSGGASSLTDLSDVGSATQGVGRLLISDGSNFHSIAMSGDCTILASGVISCPAAGGGDAITVASSSIDTTADFTDDGTVDFTLVDGGAGGPDTIHASLDASGVAAASYTAPTITVGEDGRLSYAASGLLTGLSDVGSSTQGVGRLLISDGTNFDSIAVSGDFTLTAAGVATADAALAYDWATFRPESAKISGTFITAGASIEGGDRVFGLVYDTDSDDQGMWSMRMPDSFTSTPVMTIIYTSDVASGTVGFETDVMCVSAGETILTAGFDTVNDVTNGTTVPGTIGLTGEITMPLTNNDSMAANDLCVFRINRDVDDDDTAAGDCTINALQLEWTR